MEVFAEPVLIISIVLLISIFSSIVAFRIGAPLLLFFLGIGIALGPQVLAIVPHLEPRWAYFVGQIALTIILFESGFNTPLKSIRVAAAPALTLALLGVVLTTALVAICTHWVLALSWPEAFLVGSILSPTDAAAVFFLLRVGGITLQERTRSILEIESSSNDPIAIVLTLALLQWVTSITGEPIGLNVLQNFLVQLLGGGLIGAGSGLALIWILNRVSLEENLYTILSLALALFAGAVANTLGASGFLAVYLMGLMAGNARLKGSRSLRQFHNGLSWLSQIFMFVILGFIATPRDFPGVIWSSINIALGLLLFARPIAVALCLIPFRLSWREITFISWVGLRGAVSILLALLPMLFYLPNNQAIFNTIFLVVILSLVLQGWTLRPLARWLGLIIPPRFGPVERMELELPGGIDYDLVAYKIPEGSPVAEGLHLPRWARPALMMRNGRILNMRAARQLQANDHVYLLTLRRRVPLLDRLFAVPKSLSEDDRDFYGDVALHPKALVADIVQKYGLKTSSNLQDLTLADLFRAEYGDTFVVGDRVRLAGVDFIVRETDSRGLASVGLALKSVEG